MQNRAKQHETIKSRLTVSKSGKGRRIHMCVATLTHVALGGKHCIVSMHGIVLQTETQHGEDLLGQKNLLSL